MTKNSFQFGQFNSVDDWGIKIIANDFLMPPKRDSRIQIPFKSGSYVRASKPIYDDRTLRLECMLWRKISKFELRQIAYELSNRRQIRIWNEPQLYYVGEIYNPSEVLDFPQECAREFEIEFSCDPFAYSEPIKKEMISGENNITYGGTAETPTLIMLKNNNNYSVSNIQITITKKGE